MPCDAINSVAVTSLFQMDNSFAHLHTNVQTLLVIDFSKMYLDFDPFLPIIVASIGHSHELALTLSQCTKPTIERPLYMSSFRF